MHLYTNKSGLIQSIDVLFPEPTYSSYVLEITVPSELFHTIHGNFENILYSVHVKSTQIDRIN